jgi:SAM-dependent methyltransferase
MITANPKVFWSRISAISKWRDYILPNRTDKEFNEEGLLEAENIAKEFRLKRTANPTNVCIDYGCGIGRITKHFKKYAKRMIGLDICKEFIEKAKAIDSCEYYTTDEFKEEEVADIVFSVSVLQHNDEPNRKEIMQRIHSLLKPGGICYVTFPYDWRGSVYTETPFLHRFSPEEVMALASDFKYKFIELRNLVRYGGKEILLGETHELVLIAKK